jgi:hypothetical protein
MNTDHAQGAATSTTPGHSASLDPLVAKLIEELKSPDLFSRALTHYIVSELVAALLESGATSDTTVDLPLSGESHEVRNTKDDDGFGMVCISHFISAFGHQLVEWQTCDTVLADGAGHTTAQVQLPDASPPP